ncbi:MAG: glycine cleavage system protein GcvH [Kiritimatiellae bacterium]|nr:glycine cleavage system protein GcvH [Kiritimatiellia bacterium]MDD5519992.1 glycine cleavage system protein GcvH [Kiritimatiellia bacterium]
MSPEDRKYTKTHEWIKIEGNIAVIGITDHAQKALGDITFIELPAIGKVVAQGQECGVIESVKAASDIYAPASGKVAEVNSLVVEKPETVNQDAYGKGWMFKLFDFDAGQVSTLLGAKEYDQTVGQE